MLLFYEKAVTLANDPVRAFCELHSLCIGHPNLQGHLQKDSSKKIFQNYFLWRKHARPICQGELKIFRKQFLHQNFQIFKFSDFQQVISIHDSSSWLFICSWPTFFSKSILVFPNCHFYVLHHMEYLFATARQRESHTNS